MRYYNPNLTVWENLFNMLIGLAIPGGIFLICHLVEKAKEKKAADSQKNETNNV